LYENIGSDTGRNTPHDKSFKDKTEEAKDEFLNKSVRSFIDVLEVEDEQIFNDSFMQQRADIKMEREHEIEIKDQIKSLIIRNQKKTEERNENICSYDSFFKSKELENNF
jgi:Rps23 Pro-64 3,4-dihydroxylase Tpa1-like proline 4-hydroxylase